MSTAALPPTAAPRMPVPGSDLFRVCLGFTLLAGVASIVTLAGLLTLERRFLVPLGIATAVATLVGLYVRGGSLRRVADGISLRALVLLHAARAPIGVSFFVLEATVGLDPTFSRVAGWGDVLVGLLAPAVALLLPARTPSRRSLVLAWNALAFLDILAAFGTAQRALLFTGQPESMSALLAFPGPLLPFVIVPVVMTTHLLLFRRLRRGDTE